MIDNSLLRSSENRMASQRVHGSNTTLHHKAWHQARNVQQPTKPEGLWKPDGGRTLELNWKDDGGHTATYISEITRKTQNHLSSAIRKIINKNTVTACWRDPILMNITWAQENHLFGRAYLADQIHGLRCLTFLVNTELTWSNTGVLANQRPWGGASQLDRLDSRPQLPSRHR
jgi:hypothetical protein